MVDERRKYMRFGASISGEFQVRNTQTKGLLIADNFSRGGFKAILNHKIEQGATLDCEMTFPETIMPFFSAGKVVWVKDCDEDRSSKFDVGIELESMDPTERQFLVDYCYKKWNNSRVDSGKTEFDL
ncbi:MAG: PilZ domain-containing protein [Candidatus Omnitrophica bacterium]|nr:PilZ domain-containing protein [Candidatus Omnitrophota bacterium]